MDRAIVHAMSHQVHLAPFDVEALFPPHPWDAEAVAVQGLDPRSVLVCTGIAQGPVAVSYGEGPPSPEQARLAESDWDVTRLTIPVEEPLNLCGLDDGTVVEVFEPDVPGPHHVLVAGRGRGTHRDLVVDDPVEEYLLLVWLADT